MSRLTAFLVLSNVAALVGLAVALTLLATGSAFQDPIAHAADLRMQELREDAARLEARYEALLDAQLDRRLAGYAQAERAPYDNPVGYSTVIAQRSDSPAPPAPTSTSSASAHDTDLAIELGDWYLEQARERVMAGQRIQEFLVRSRSNDNHYRWLSIGDLLSAARLIEGSHERLLFRSEAGDIYPIGTPVREVVMARPTLSTGFNPYAAGADPLDGAPTPGLAGSTAAPPKPASPPTAPTKPPNQPGPDDVVSAPSPTATTTPGEEPAPGVTAGTLDGVDVRTDENGRRLVGREGTLPTDDVLDAMATEGDTTTTTRAEIAPGVPTSVADGTSTGTGFPAAARPEVPMLGVDGVWEHLLAPADVHTLKEEPSAVMSGAVAEMALDHRGHPNGVRIRLTGDSSWFSRNGIKSGDVILRTGDQVIRTSGQLQDVIAGDAWIGGQTVEVLRDGESHRIRFAFEPLVYEAYLVVMLGESEARRQAVDEALDSAGVDPNAPPADPAGPTDPAGSESGMPTPAAPESSEEQGGAAASESAAPGDPGAGSAAGGSALD